MTSKSRVVKDDEFWALIALNAFFGLILIAVNIWYSDWPGIFSHKLTTVAGIVLVIGHIIAALLWVIVVREWKDPNCDKCRWQLFLLVVFTIIATCGFRAYKNELKAMYDDSTKSRVYIDGELVDSLGAVGYDSIIKSAIAMNPPMVFNPDNRGDPSFGERIKAHRPELAGLIATEDTIDGYIKYTINNKKSLMLIPDDYSIEMDTEGIVWYIGGNGKREKIRFGHSAKDEMIQVLLKCILK